MNKRTPPGHFVPTIVPFDPGAIPPTQESRSFVWGDESTSIKEQRPVAAYFNPDDDLIIRQQETDDPRNDAIIIIRGNNIPDFAAHLFDLLGYQHGGRRA